MAVLTKPWVLGSVTTPTRVARNQTAAIFGQPTLSHANAVTATTRGGAYGVIAGGDLLVTATTGLGWSCAPGRLVGIGTSATAQGAYTGLNDAAQTGTLNARDATFSRITLICYRIRDTDEDATGFEDDAIVMIDGTPAASPAVPSIPASLGSLVVLSEVLVPIGATAPTFTDRRAYATAIGGVMRVTSSSTRPTGGALWEGLYIDEMDTDRTWRYSGSAWVPVQGRWGVSLGQTAGITATGGTTTGFTFDSESVDTDAYHVAGTGSIVIPSGLGGVYVVTARGLTAGTPSATWTVNVLLNGSAWFSAVGSGSNTAFPTASGVQTLNAGDTLTMTLNNSGSSFTAQAGLSAYRVAA